MECDIVLVSGHSELVIDTHKCTKFDLCRSKGVATWKGACNVASTRISFTKGALLALSPAAAGKQATYYDTRIPGLMLLVTANGAKTFYVYRRINGRPERVKIGRFPDLTVEQARRMAEETNGAIARGEDPAQKRRETQKEPTFGELFTWYLESHAKVRKQSWKADEWLYKAYLKGLSGYKATKITRADVRELHAAIGRGHGPYAANRTLALVRTIYNKAVAYDKLTQANPATGVEMFREESRDRRLTPAEMAAFVAAVADEPNPDMRDFVLLSLYTGARKANVLAMRWSEINFKEETWRIPVTKNGKPQTIPLLAAELAILHNRQADAAKSPWVFPGHGATGHLVEPKSGWNRILKKAGIQNLRIHDLRRSLGSFMVDTGASLPVIGKTLGHQSVSATAIYARMALDPIKEAKALALAAMDNASRS